MIDTIHIGAGSYPSAPEPEEETEYEVTLKTKIRDTFPESWDKDLIKQYIEENLVDYLEYKEIEVIDIY